MTATVAQLRNFRYILCDVVAEYDDGWYQVSIRGSQGKSFRARRNDLIFLSHDHASIEVEKKRRILFDRISNDSPKYLKDRALAVELAEEVVYLLAKNTKQRGDRLPEAVEHKVHARFVEAYYAGQGILLTHNNGMMKYTGLLQSLNPFLSINVDASGQEVSCQRYVGTTGSMVKRFEELVLQDPSNSARLFFRAILYARFVEEHSEGPDDNRIDAFMLTFAAIQALQGNIASLRPHKGAIEQSVDSFFADYGIDLHERLSQHKIPTMVVPGSHMHSLHLLWCLCHMCLTIGFVVREKLIPESEFERLLPNPFGNTTDEQFKIGTYLIDSRPENPTSYLKVYDMIMDTITFRPPDIRGVWLENAYHIMRLGKDVATAVGDPFACHHFQTLFVLWMPTLCMPLEDTVTVSEAMRMLAVAKQQKMECAPYLPECMFLRSKASKNAFLAFVKSFQLPDDDRMIKFPTFEYFVYRFHSVDCNYYLPGGKFDQLKTAFKCAHCSRLLVKRYVCSRCKKVDYCSKACQKEHWKAHRCFCQTKGNNK